MLRFNSIAWIIWVQILIRKPEGKRPLGRAKRSLWQYDRLLKCILKEFGMAVWNGFFWFKGISSLFTGVE
jgi:hypothetical protein